MNSAVGVRNSVPWPTCPGKATSFGMIWDAFCKQNVVTHERSTTEAASFGGETPNRSDDMKIVQKYLMSKIALFTETEKCWQIS